MAAVFGISSYDGLPMVYNTSHSPPPQVSLPPHPPAASAGGSYNRPYCYGAAGVAAGTTTADAQDELRHHHLYPLFDEAADDGYLLMDENLLNFGAEQEVHTDHGFPQKPEAMITQREWENGTKKEKNAHARVKIGFRTKSQVDVMDDGYKWRKYGKKIVKNSPNPRNYYKCSIEGCCVKKRVERDRADAAYVITTYEGTHNHTCPADSARRCNAPLTAPPPPSSSPFSYHSPFHSSSSSPSSFSSYYRMMMNVNPNTWSI